jgi:hypothetical protein
MLNTIAFSFRIRKRIFSNYFIIIIVMILTSCNGINWPTAENRSIINISVTEATNTTTINDSIRLTLNTSDSSSIRNYFYLDSHKEKKIDFSKIITIPGHTFKASIDYLSAICPALDPEKDKTLYIDNSVVFYAIYGGETLFETPVRYKFDASSILINYRK